GGIELAVQVQHLGANQLAVLQLLDRELHTVVACLGQELIGGDVAGAAALTVDRWRARSARLAESVVESVFVALPVEAAEARDHVCLALRLVELLDGVGDRRGDETVRLR